MLAAAYMEGVHNDAVDRGNRCRCRRYKCQRCWDLTDLCECPLRKICYPATALRPQREADNGDGRKFLGAGGAELLVLGQFNATDSSLDQWAADEARIYTGKRGRITYRAARPNWVVLSGDDGGRFAFYNKTLEREDEFVTFQLKYPTAKARLFRPIVQRLSRCLRLTRLPD